MIDKEKIDYAQRANYTAHFWLSDYSGFYNKSIDIENATVEECLLLLLCEVLNSIDLKLQLIESIETEDFDDSVKKLHYILKALTGKDIVELTEYLIEMEQEKEDIEIL